MVAAKENPAIPVLLASLITGVILGVPGFIDLSALDEEAKL
jgi:hypothetical protein